MAIEPVSGTQEILKIESVMSAQQKLEAAKAVSDFNATLNNGKAPRQNLDKDDFLKLLITQLSYQDPTAPMEDKEFIAQMAQFSSLEQMTSMAGDFAKLTQMITSNEASSALGRHVEIIEGEQLIRGAVSAVNRGDIPTVMVNGMSYPWEQVSRIYEE
jgi:flagellar basal-body rod modification protein FlgD